MAAETAKEFQALEAQAQTLMAAFAKAGYEPVAPAIIQPASVFLDVVGEALRARTYVFTDPDGEELCLRPDLTVPTGLLHLERHPAGSTKAKYCYNGAAFRFQPSGAGLSHPREFRQAGIESFGATEREKAEAHVLATIVSAVKSAGLTGFQLRIGDLGLFRALLRAADMPERWRQRLKHQFWRPEAFRAELKRLSGAAADTRARIPPALTGALDTENVAASERAVQAYLETSGIELTGVRSVAEITASLLGIVEDANAEPLPAATVALIDSYLAVKAPARAAGARLKDLMRDKGIDISIALEQYLKRLQLLADAGVDVVHAEFSAEFGRALEYYTGFVFEIVAPALGPGSPIAGGGRYDSLLRQIGAPGDVPAVGAAVHTERLLASCNGGTS